MFERLTVNDAGQSKAVAVEITLADERTVMGKINIPATRTVFAVLNGDGGFIDFCPFEGEQEYISKSAIRAVRPLQKMRCVGPEALANRTKSFDPHAILQIDKGTDAESLRQAYLRMTKLYHPDRFANAGLPQEVRDYLGARAQQINLAYDVLKSAQSKAKAAHSRPAAS